MRAWELHARPGFEALTQVAREPRPLGARDVRVRIHAVSLNYRDIVLARAAQARARTPPVIAGSDGAGEVVEVGASVHRLRPGDRVAGLFFPTWLDGEISAAHHASALGGAHDGMLAEEVVLDETAWIEVPAHLSYAQAATLPCAGVTAYHALFEKTHLGPGDTLLVQGSGGVAMFALQLARAVGARVVVTSRSAAKHERIRALGADHVIDYVATPAWGEAAWNWAGGLGVDMVVDVGGPGTFDQSVAALRYGGTMSLLGVLTGVRGEINTYGIFHKALRVHGIYVGSRRMFESLNRAVTATALEPIVDRVFTFDDVPAAYEYLAGGHHIGKVVVAI